MPYLQETRISWSADQVKPKNRCATLGVCPCSIYASCGISRMQADSILLQEGGGLHEFQRLNSGDCSWLSSAWNPCRSSCGSGCGLDDESIFFRIQHQYKYPVAFSGHIFVSELGILADSPAHQTCRARIHASCVLATAMRLSACHCSLLDSSESAKPGCRQGVGLTCLSVRCLSSYLLFSASSSDQQLRAELARGDAPSRGSA